MNLKDEAARLFPSWTEAKREAWIAAREYSARCTPHFARLLPLTETKVVHASTFAPRTLREAGFTS